MSVVIAGAYLLGVRHNQKYLIMPTKASFVTSLAAIEDLRLGKKEEALTRLEAHCYSTAVQLLSRGADRESTIKIMMPELVLYRQRYATNRESWSMMECQLVRMLETHSWLVKSNEEPKTLAK
jgi:hypothetical protein